MPRLKGAVHVAVTRKHYKGKEYKTHLLRRSYRENGRVQKETLANISHFPEAIIEKLRCALRGEHSIVTGDLFELVTSRPYGHVAAVLGTLRRIGLEGVIASRHSRERDLVVAMIVASVIDQTAPAASSFTVIGATSLSLLLGIQDVTAKPDDTSRGGEITVDDTLRGGASTADDLGAALDWLAMRQRRLQAKLAAKHLGPAEKMKTDHPKAIAAGSSRPEVACCVIAALEGADSAKADPSSALRRTLLGLLSSRDGFPVALEVFKGRVNDPSALRPTLMKLRASFGLTRLIAVGRRSELTEERIRKELRPARLQWITDLAPWALEKLMNSSRRWTRNRAGQRRDGALPAEITARTYPGERLILFREDGLGAVRTSVRATEFDPTQILEAYKRLPAVEKVFRGLARTDLAAITDGGIQSAGRRADTRARARLLICMLAYYVEWHMRQALASVLSDTHVDSTARHSFRSFDSLLTELARLRLNTLRVRGTDAEFHVIAQPSVLHKRIFSLLSLRLSK